MAGWLSALGQVVAGADAFGANPAESPVPWLARSTALRPRPANRARTATAAARSTPTAAGRLLPGPTGDPLLSRWAASLAAPAASDAGGLMAGTRTAKRFVLGRQMATEQLGETLLPKRLALPVFASDALSSNAYATQEILLVLSLGGFAFFSYSPFIAGGVVLVFAIVVLSYRQNVHAYPSGGGDYEVVSTNLGQRAGVLVASALLVDYVLTVAVSISSAVDNITSAVPAAGAVIRWCSLWSC